MSLGIRGLRLQQLLIAAIGGQKEELLLLQRRLSGMGMGMGLDDGGRGKDLLETIVGLQLLQLQVLALQDLLALLLHVAKDAVLLVDVLVELLRGHFR